MDDTTADGLISGRVEPRDADTSESASEVAVNGAGENDVEEDDLFGDEADDDDVPKYDASKVAVCVHLLTPRQETTPS